MNDRASLIIKFLIFSFLILAGSCIGYKKSLYFQGDQQTIAPVKISETYKLRSRDIIQIKISTPDPESSQLLNIQSENVAVQAYAYFTDYYISDSGYVELPLTGKIFVKDFTLVEVDSIITRKAKEYFNFYTVDVKLASFKFSALGEFAKPGQYYVANENCTIYEALAIAGDASDFANKTKIQIIRSQADGSKKIMHLDLTDYSGFTQENFYIQPNDIIYIQPQKAKTDKQNIAYLTVGLAAFTTLLLILSRFNI